MVWIKLLVPIFVGGTVGLATMFGLVYSQTSAPDDNPASEPILVYGN